MSESLLPHNDHTTLLHNYNVVGVQVMDVVRKVEEPWPVTYTVVLLLSSSEMKVTMNIN